jgi:ribosomal protein S3
MIGVNLMFHRACYGVLRFIMESGAKGCEVIVSGKLRGQRAKSMKFVDGLMIHSGDPMNDYVDQAVRHVLLRQGKRGVMMIMTTDIFLELSGFLNQLFSSNCWWE